MATKGPSVSFWRGNKASLPTTATNGAVYFVEDEKALYLDHGDTRHRFGTIGLVESITALNNVAVTSGSNPLYYAANDNVLAYFNGTNWIQINDANSSLLSLLNDDVRVGPLNSDTGKRELGLLSVLSKSSKIYSGRTAITAVAPGELLSTIEDLPFYAPALASNSAQGLMSATAQRAVSTTLPNAIAAAASAVTAVSTTVNAHTTSINAISTTVNAHTTAINSISSTVATHTTKINNLGSAVTAVSTTVNDILSKVSGAMHFVGVTTTALADGSTATTLAGSGLSKTTGFAAGDVVLYGDGEFVWTGSTWEQMGDAGSFKTKQTAVSSPAASGSATAFIDTISQNANGDITVTKKNVNLSAYATAASVTAALANYKPTQTAVSSPTASSTALAFIDTISQNANGVITATKKNIPEASSTTAGLMSAADKAKLEGIATSANNYVHPTFTAFTGTATYSANANTGSVVVNRVTTNTNGHVSTATNVTLTITSATTAKAGLMSAADKVALDAATTAINNLNTSLLWNEF